MLNQLIIGIDPGVNTGFATSVDGKLLKVASMRIDEAMALVASHQRMGTVKLVVYEDARLRKWFGSKGREALQGAGSVKRDSQIWADFLAGLGCATLALAPQKGASKWSSDYFKRVTGWAERTNQHGRDAAVLILGRK
jgi:hypothetical protein